ncbi:hypothetical protein L208DRAFT_1406830 [Tricholoma matsutake]|nr:hypothetical protein L208DRAFT_1406830 [Tricholoma matsutake 945]
MIRRCIPQEYLRALQTLLAENAQTSQNGQLDFTQALRMITHSLRMHRHPKMVRVTSHRH